MYILSNKMGGGLMQLVAYGAQDIYLTGNPQITFFKVVYRRHTNFSMEAIQQTWNGSSTTDGRCTATISRNGDLVHKMYLELTGDTSGTALCDNGGSKCITSVEVEIGGQRIDKQSGLFMETWAELTLPNPGGQTGTTGVKTGTLFQNMSAMGGSTWGDTTGESTLHVPLQFWFCRNPGLALPLIALQYHEVKIILEHQYKTFFSASMSKNNLWCDYIYLDTEERRRFAQVSHEYLIEQVQQQSLTEGAVSSDLNFNHPVKELIWVDNGTTFDNTATPVDNKGSLTAVSAGTGTYSIKLNGHERFSPRNWLYFTRTQVLQHHSGCGGLDSNSAAAVGRHNDSIAVYSFALKPEEHQPSGTCNFSRIDNAQLVATGSSVADTIFAINYNVLRVMSGMGGLAYSN
jgi:hypothetical protein